MDNVFINAAYILAAVLFIFGLKMLGSPATARRGNFLSALGMLIAIVVTLTSKQIVAWEWIVVALVTGAIIGALAARLVAMTGMPEMVAIFNGFGGGASLLVGWAALFGEITTLFAISVVIYVVIGGVTFAGSVIVWGELAEWLPSKALVFVGQRFFNSMILIALVTCMVMFAMDPAFDSPYLYAVVGLALVLGIFAVIPIGGADMPVVISLLNSYSGLAACAAGFAINNIILIVADSLVGAAGMILTNIMCKAMNRSLPNVLFSGFGAVKTGSVVEGEVKPINPADASIILEAASSVTFVPGYGMAVAQAQHVECELGELLEKTVPK